MQQLIKTRFTERFSINHPIMSAPMDKISSGKLAAAVSNSGGLGIIGGGYGETNWIEQAFAELDDPSRVGIGFITWSVSTRPELLDLTLAYKPAALMVSFGDGESIVRRAKLAGVPTIWQVQKLKQAKQALSAGVDVIVVQGQEAGGHGMDRGLTALLPAVRDISGPDQIIIAAGGIADGRGLASVLLSGADGVMMGTRFWASKEAKGSSIAKNKLIHADGDNTVRSNIFDMARGYNWPPAFTGRVLENEFSSRWKSETGELNQDLEAKIAEYQNSEEDDYSIRALIAGEAVDLIKSVDSAEKIIGDTVEEAAQILLEAPNLLV